ncbi:Tryptophan--tRNA ligase, mitochondrial [Podila minutissima]|uniref:Tryptophan--tRNA ligase, mitochondrial n=1 Tax=Podila minutissima TaxID=64525 RepID=A0A9P5SBB4_9FUNG|nr:Tryptophan--tRNA ligase, mitochondrial [Podila minutissima]
MTTIGRTVLAGTRVTCAIRSHSAKLSTASRFYSTQKTKDTQGSSNKSKPQPKPVIFSGIQPTGQPHLGNYLGAISNWVTLQEQAHDANETLLFSVVDLHAITMPQNPDKLRKERREMAITLLACGIDPKKCILFEQSKVSGHAELAWILNCMTPFGWLARMTQWKSKMGVTRGIQSIEDVSSTAGLQLGLFAYPVLMAADVLLYKATKIPVGEDQVQHLELARDIAVTFNKTVKQPFFPLPRPVITETKRVMSLRDPTNKMSKSDASDQTRINLVDAPEVIRSKIRKATTDGIRGISYDRAERPAVANLVDMYAAIGKVSVEDVVREHAQSTNAQFKDALAEGIITALSPIQKEMERLGQDVGYVETVLQQGATRANEIARPNLEMIQTLVGLR